MSGKIDKQKEKSWKKNLINAGKKPAKKRTFDNFSAPISERKADAKTTLSFSTDRVYNEKKKRRLFKKIEVGETEFQDDMEKTTKKGRPIKYVAVEDRIGSAKKETAVESVFLGEEFHGKQWKTIQSSNSLFLEGVSGVDEITFDSVDAPKIVRAKPQEEEDEETRQMEQKSTDLDIMMGDDDPDVIETEAISIKKPKKDRRRKENGEKQEETEKTEQIEEKKEEKPISEELKKQIEQRKLKNKRKKDRKKKIKEMKQEKAEQRNQQGDDDNVEMSSEEDSSDDEGAVKEPLISMEEWRVFKEKKVIHPKIYENIQKELKFATPTPIQESVLNVLITKPTVNLVTAAETGSGKTLAFGIPIASKILFEKDKKMAEKLKEAAKNKKETENEKEVEAPKEYLTTALKCLILTPTRELALQIEKHLKAILKNTSIRTATLIGGISEAKQERLIRSRPQFVIATPGRYWDLTKQGGFEHLMDLSQLQFLVFDEADRMIKEGNYPELLNIMSFINKFRLSSESKTMPSSLQQFVVSATLTLNEQYREQGKKPKKQQKSEDSDEENEAKKEKKNEKKKHQNLKKRQNVKKTGEKQEGEPNENVSWVEKQKDKELREESGMFLSKAEEGKDLALLALCSDSEGESSDEENEDEEEEDEDEDEDEEDEKETKEEEKNDQSSSEDEEEEKEEEVIKEEAKEEEEKEEEPEEEEEEPEEKKTQKPKKPSPPSESEIIKKLASIIDLRNRVVIDLTTSTKVPLRIHERALQCVPTEKDDYLYYFMLHYNGKTICFVNSISTVRHIHAIFKELGLQERIFTLHGEMEQKRRMKHLENFINCPESKGPVLVCTDVAARGIDIPAVDHVIQFHLPRSAEVYVHRVGRTGRAGRDGDSVCFVSPQERSSYFQICQATNKPGNAMDSFSVKNTAAMQIIVKRIEVAKKLASAKLKISKKVNDFNWFKAKAQDMGIVVDSEFFVQKRERVTLPSKKLAKEKIDLQERLNSLMIKPLPGVGKRSKNLKASEQKNVPTIQEDDQLKIEFGA